MIEARGDSRRKKKEGSLHLNEEGKTLKVTPEAHEALANVGLKTETFSDIILRLVRFYKEHQ
jgi:hypothetical protein